MLEVLLDLFVLGLDYLVDGLEEVGVVFVEGDCFADGDAGFLEDYVVLLDFDVGCFVYDEGVL